MKGIVILFFIVMSAPTETCAQGATKVNDILDMTIAEVLKDYHFSERIIGAAKCQVVIYCSEKCADKGMPQNANDCFLTKEQIFIEDIRRYISIDDIKLSEHKGILSIAVIDTNNRKKGKTKLDTYIFRFRKQNGSWKLQR